MPLSLFRSLMYFVPSYFLAIGGYLALNVVAARILGTADFGYFVALVAATMLIGQFSLLGVHRSGLREAAHADSEETLRELRRGVRSVLLIPLPIAATATAGAVWLWRGGDPDGIATAALSGVLVFAAGYQKVSVNFLRGLGHVRAASMITGRSGGALVALVQASCVLLVAWLAPAWGLPGVLAGTAAGYVLPLVWAGWLLRRSWPHAEPPKRTLHDLRLVIKRDWRFAISQAGGFLNSTVELWLAGAILSAGATSLFAAGQRIGHLLLIPSTSLQIVFSPALARLAKKGDHGQLEPLVRTAATVSSAASGVLWVPIMLVPGLVLTIVFGEGFEAAAPVLMLLASGYLLNSISGMSATTLSMAHHEGDVALINWCAVVLRLISGVVCAGLWGVTGLAASSAAIATLHYAASWSAVRWRLSISTHATLRPKLALLGRISG
jgi:O-antigen/teichoic acid export membrane protein